MSRFDDLYLDPAIAGVLSPEQRRVYRQIENGPRRDVPLPFKIWLHSPELLDHLQDLGLFLRNRISFSAAQAELAILLTARFWNSPYVWRAHEPLAVAAGLDQAVIEAINTGSPPPFRDEHDQVIFDACSELYGIRTIEDATYANVVRLFGKKAVVELIGLLSYYAALSMTVNVAQLPLPQAAKN